MQAVLYICHGSRVKPAVQEAIQFIQKTMTLVDKPIQECCFLELANPSIREGIAKCVQQGATKIAFVPVLLLTAAHAKKDIPNEIVESMKEFEAIEYSYGRPLGVHELMVDVLIDRLSEKTTNLSDLHVLLVGRGSSDPDAVDDIKLLATILQKRTFVSSVDVCFLAAAEPNFEYKLEQMITSGNKRIFILSYLLFTGVLMDDIRRTVQQIDKNPEQEIIIGDYLGSHPKVYTLLKTRVMEATEGGKYFAALA